MDLEFKPEDLAFRNEVRSFIEQNYPAHLTDLESRDQIRKEDFLLWQKILFKKGWGAPAWPKQYGGTGWTPTQRYIFQEECARAETIPIPPFGPSMLAPVLMAFGTDQQKAHYLPRIVNGTDFWCQGYSEPGAGSDLASLKTKAVREGDHYIVNGQKTWTTLGHYADWSFVLCRTDPKAKKPQEGISFLLVDMKTPGVEVRPIVMLDGGYEVKSTVFLTDVKVPVANRSARKTKAGPTPNSCSPHERTGIAGVARSKKGVERLKEIATAESRRRRAAHPQSRFPAQARRTRNRSHRARIDRAPRAGVREQAAGGRARKLAAEDQGHRDPAAPDRAHAGSRRQLWRALLPRFPEGWRQRSFPSAPTTPTTPRRSTSTCARPRSTAAPTRSSATSSPRWCWGCDDSACHPGNRVAIIRDPFFTLCKTMDGSRVSASLRPG